MAAKVMNGRDPYFWQNDDVLKNRLNIHDAAQLRKAELAFSTLRATTIELGPKHPGLPHLRQIHRTLFQDIYDWAGELRNVDLYQDDTPYCHCEYLEKEGNALMAGLEEENGLQRLEKQAFVERLAWYYGEINMLHPFRDGNGRAQRLFFEQVALHAGYLIDWSQTERESWLAASQQAAAGETDALAAIFAKVVSEAK
ncbi:cell filamentation protein Fic [Duffyella gerundensis]|jgi:cell filamentation protein|uniref:putative adenosine monophosphate-protein transferase Fic n=1 Tax=Duffyella gerundensis TaxID=1619313 RepID=UPI001CE31996|nr:putative adenosine monophosphate-protein transferase Fic [Duffyella gerundensis]UCB32522.1 cell filamentation protein Fic [Duffyella gerundensis]